MFTGSTDPFLNYPKMYPLKEDPSMKRFPAFPLLFAALLLLVPVSRAQTGHVLNGVDVMLVSMTWAVYCPS